MAKVLFYTATASQYAALTTIMRKEPDGTGIVLDPAHGHVLHMNASGVLLWNAIVRGMERDALAKELVREFEVEETLAEADVRKFLASLREKHLLNDFEQ